MNLYDWVDEMKTFRITVVRQTNESTMFEVEAKNEKDAENEGYRRVTSPSSTEEFEWEPSDWAGTPEVVDVEEL